MPAVAETLDTLQSVTRSGYKWGWEPAIDFQDIHYYAAPKQKPGPQRLEDVDPELLRTYEKLGIPLRERAILAGVEGASGEGSSQIAVDAVFDSVSVATTF